MKKIVVISLSILSAVCLSACSDSPEYIAKVDGDPVASSDVDSYLDYKRINKVDPELRAKGQQVYLDNLVLMKAIQKQDSFNEQAFEAELFELKKDLLLNRYLLNYLDQAVNDTAVRNYYAENQSKYEETKAKVSHILLRVEPNISEEERQVIFSKALEAYSRLKSGESFADVAVAYSDDKVSAAKGGRLGWMTKGAISPEFSQAVFSELEQGQFSSPVLTSFGYHIILLEEAPSTAKVPFEKVNGDIRRILRATAKEAELKRLRETVEVSAL